MRKRFLLAAILGTLSLTSCGKDQGETLTLAPDPAKAGPCLKASITVPGDLDPLNPFTVAAGSIVVYDDGRKIALPEPVVVVALDVVYSRDGKTTKAYLSERAARQLCQSYAAYVVDWTAKAKATASGATK